MLIYCVVESYGNDHMKWALRQLYVTTLTLFFSPSPSLKLDRWNLQLFSNKLKLSSLTLGVLFFPSHQSQFVQDISFLASYPSFFFSRISSLHTLSFSHNIAELKKNAIELVVDYCNLLACLPALLTLYTYSVLSLYPTLLPFHRPPVSQPLT
jgi:hypothetical protein